MTVLNGPIVLGVPAEWRVCPVFWLSAILWGVFRLTEETFLRDRDCPGGRRLRPVERPEIFLLFYPFLMDLLRKGVPYGRWT